MCAAVFSCGHRITFGACPRRARPAIASMMGAWSVPMLQNKYSMPILQCLQQIGRGGRGVDAGIR
jgi:hypothetical protein